MLDRTGWLQTVTVGTARAWQIRAIEATGGGHGDAPLPRPERVAEGKARLMRLAAERRERRPAA